MKFQLSLIVAFSNLALAGIAFWQMLHIRLQNKPKLVLQKIGEEKYLLRNLGRDFAYNFNIKVPGDEKKIATTLDVDEYIYMEIPLKELALAHYEKQAVNISVSYSSKIKETNKILFNIDPDKIDTFIAQKINANAEVRFNTSF